MRTTYECGWAELTNGALLSAAESGGYHVLLTTDRNLPYQQSIGERTIAVIVLIGRASRVPELLPLVPAALVALEMISAGEVVRIQQPDSSI